MAANLTNFTGDDRTMKEHAKELLQQEYGQGEQETYVPKYQVEHDPYPPP